MVRSACHLIILFAGYSSIAQTYSVSSFLNRTSGSCAYLAGSSCVNVSINYNGNKPSSLQVHYYQWDDCVDINGNLCGYICEGSETIGLPDIDCYSGSFGVGGCGAAGTFTISWSPNITITGSPPGDYCANESITLHASSGFSYVWQYSINSGSWHTFNSGTQSVTVDIESLVGYSYLNANVFFRYHTMSCNSVFATTGPSLSVPLGP